MGNFKNTFSWSNSRIGSFQHCKRKYYYQYYLFWEGWEAGVPDIVNKTYMLKNLQNIHGLIGSYTHKYISEHIRNILNFLTDNKVNSNQDKLYEINRECLYNKIKTEVERFYAKSQNKLRNKAFPQILKENSSYNRAYLKDLGLVEHYTAQIANETDNLMKKAIIDQIFTNVMALEPLPIYRYMVDWLTKAQTLALRYYVEPERVDFDADIFHFPWNNINIRCFAKPDVYFESVDNSDHKIIILDWKTGRTKNKEFNDSISSQLKIYAYRIVNDLFSEQKEFPNVKIEAYEVYLPSGDITGGIVNKDHYNDIENKISEDISSISQMLVDNDIVANIPKDMTFFERSDNKATCKYCQFKELCDDKSMAG